VADIFHVISAMQPRYVSQELAPTRIYQQFAGGKLAADLLLLH